MTGRLIVILALLAVWSCKSTVRSAKNDESDHDKHSNSSKESMAGIHSDRLTRSRFSVKDDKIRVDYADSEPIIMTMSAHRDDDEIILLITVVNNG